MAYVIRRIEDNAYLSSINPERAYTTRREDAITYAMLHEALSNKTLTDRIHFEVPAPPED